MNIASENTHRAGRSSVLHLVTRSNLDQSQPNSYQSTSGCQAHLFSSRYASPTICLHRENQSSSTTDQLQSDEKHSSNTANHPNSTPQRVTATTRRFMVRACVPNIVQNSKDSAILQGNFSDFDTATHKRHRR